MVSRGVGRGLCFPHLENEGGQPCSLLKGGGRNSPPQSHSTPGAPAKGVLSSTMAPVCRMISPPQPGNWEPLGWRVPEEIWGCLGG